MLDRIAWGFAAFIILVLGQSATWVQTLGRTTGSQVRRSTLTSLPPARPLPPPGLGVGAYGAGTNKSGTPNTSGNLGGRSTGWRWPRRLITIVGGRAKRDILAIRDRPTIRLQACTPTAEYMRPFSVTRTWASLKLVPDTRSISPSLIASSQMVRRGHEVRQASIVSRYSRG